MTKALKQYGPDLVAFVAGLGAAWILKWNTKDLVWSLWLSSLTLGYLTILSTVAAGVWTGVNALEEPSFPRAKRGGAVLAIAGVALFVVGFFSLHFCAFHATHAVFLSFFFPINGVSQTAFVSAFMNPLLLWKTVFQHIWIPYGIFLIPALIAERAHLFAAFADVGGISDSLRTVVRDPKAFNAKKLMHDPFSRPYANVMRMHLLIFFFFFCHFLKIESFVVYGVVYFVYFFPWRMVRPNAEKMEEKKRQGAYE
jgi:hypothetical protein